MNIPQENQAQHSGPKRFLYYHLPAILYAALIITVSSIPDLRSPRVGALNADKLFHAGEYALFAILFYRSFSHLRRVPARLAALITILFLVVFATGDEYHQRFVRGRSMDILDLGADLLGGIITVLWLRYLQRRRVSSRPD